MRWGHSFGLFLSRPVVAGAVILGALACDGGHRPGMAQEAAGQRTEFSAGATVSRQYWSTYSGATFAPFGATLCCKKSQKSLKARFF